MHVGYGAVFQNPYNRLSDREVWRNEIRLAEMAEPLGFDSVWGIEHHFDDYTMCPDPVQFLTYMAGRTQKAKLGSMVIDVNSNRLDAIFLATNGVSRDHFTLLKTPGGWKIIQKAFHWHA